MLRATASGAAFPEDEEIISRLISFEKSLPNLFLQD
jgi:hypothetical protein